MQANNPRSSENNQKPLSTAAFAEVIESSLHGFTAQCWQWNYFPTFGSLVTIETPKRTLFGLVYQTQTGSMDPTRYPFPYQKTEEELLREQPQIFEFLKTSFSCAVIGFYEKGHYYYQISPQPAHIHAFVQPASKEQYQYFFSDERYLHVLFGLTHQVVNLDELLLALLKNLGDYHVLSPAKIAGFLEAFALLTGNDYRRLKLFLQRAQPLLKSYLEANKA